MNETIHEDNETTNGDLMDLAAGQLTFAEGVRLRLALLLDRKKAAEYARLRQLRRELRSLGTASDIPPAPAWSNAPSAVRPLSTPTVTWGKFTMKRRNVLSAYAILFLTMTGVAVARQWVNSGVYAQFVDAGRTWKLSGDFGGKATVRNADGKIIGQYSHPNENQQDSPLIVVVAGMTTPIKGAGIHPIRDKQGKLMGTVDVSPLTVEETANLQLRSEDALKEWGIRYALIPQFPLEKNEVACKTNAIGLINAVDRRRGLSWKLIGYAQVTETYPKVIRLPLLSPFSASLPWPKSGRTALYQVLGFAPNPQSEPTIYWAVAGKSSDEAEFPIENGWWKTVRQNGNFWGYGKHEIRDESGNLIVTLTVAPLKPK